MRFILVVATRSAAKGKAAQRATNLAADWKQELNDMLAQVRHHTLARVRLIAVTSGAQSGRASRDASERSLVANPLAMESQE